jgi:hypothetical protein
MSNSVQDYTLSILPPKKKRSQGGWISVNAVCCQHNGHNADTRGRGGLLAPGDGKVSWHCFNCGFKTSYTPGRQLSFKYRKFLKWLGANENDIQRLVVESIRLKNVVTPETTSQEEFSFDARSLPPDAKNIIELLESNEDSPQLLRAVEYVHGRAIDMNRYNFFWSPMPDYKLNYRILVPFYWEGKIVGYTGRSIESAIKPKYHSDHPGHFVFNTNNQLQTNAVVLVFEGPFDAMSLDGVSTQTNDISEQQADIIESLGKNVIVVPDFDKHINKQGREVWPGEVMIDRAIEYGWSVSFPPWRSECKDANDAVMKYGKLFTLKTILDSVESNPVKIQIITKKIKNE